VAFGVGLGDGGLMVLRADDSYSLYLFRLLLNISSSLKSLSTLLLGIEAKGFKGGTGGGLGFGNLFRASSIIYECVLSSSLL
jgi:hypothetical protein